MALQKNLSDSMNLIRAKRQQSITEFSEELGISRSSMQEILKGTANPRIDTVEHIAKQLQMDPLILLSPENVHANPVMPLVQTIQMISSMNPRQRQRFMALFAELVSIIDEVEDTDA